MPRLRRMDKALFEAYNSCDLKTLGAMVSDDLEFYHDKTGLAVGKQVFLDAIQKNICGKVTRELVATSLEVHSLAGYGAVEIGTHRFHHPGERNNEALGDAKFVMLWHHQGDAWVLTRVSQLRPCAVAIRASEPGSAESGWNLTVNSRPS